MHKSKIDAHAFLYDHDSQLDFEDIEGITRLLVDIFVDMCVWISSIKYRVALEFCKYPRVLQAKKFNLKDRN